MKHLIKYFLATVQHPKQVSHPIMVNSIAKSGTNLLLNIVRAIPGTRYAGDTSYAAEKDTVEERLIYIKEHIRNPCAGCVYTGHIPYAPEIAEWFRKQRIKMLFLYRDPRDVSVSVIHYVMRDANPRHEYYDMYASLETDAERLFAVINGYGEGRTRFKASPTSIPSIKFIYQAFMGWLTEPDTFPLRYEDLIADAHGKKSPSVAVINKMLKFLGTSSNSQFVRKMLQEGRNPAKSPTFRQGKIGSWREEYTADHIEAFRSVTGELLKKLGYQW